MRDYPTSPPRSASAIVAVLLLVVVGIYCAVSFVLWALFVLNTISSFIGMTALVWYLFGNTLNTDLWSIVPLGAECALLAVRAKDAKKGFPFCVILSFVPGIIAHTLIGVGLTHMELGIDQLTIFMLLFTAIGYGLLALSWKLRPPFEPIDSSALLRVRRVVRTQISNAATKEVAADSPTAPDENCEGGGE